MSEDGRDGLREALKRTAVALKESGVPFALAGGYAAWARGGPEPEHDVDFVIAEDDAAVVADSLAKRDLRVVQPPEDWLFKVFTDDAMVDVVFRLSGSVVQRETLERADELEVLSVRMPVMSATDVVVGKLNAMDEHQCDLAPHLAVARSLREQVDWDRVRSETGDNPFAAALLLLLERLGIIAADGGALPTS
jgi:hypothetical protein